MRDEERLPQAILQPGEVLEDPERVRLLDDERARPVRDPLEGEPAVLVVGDLVEGEASPPRVGSEDFPGTGVEGARDEDPLPPCSAMGHQHSLGERSGPVVQRGIGHLHPRELADHGLVLKHPGQGPLRDLGLVGGVGGGELGPGEDVTDHGRDVVVVQPTPEERDQPPAGGPLGEAGEVPLHPKLVVGGEPDGPVPIPDRSRDIGEQGVHVGDADRLQHRPDVGRGVGKVGVHPLPFTSAS